MRDNGSTVNNTVLENITFKMAHLNKDYGKMVNA
jgi:hypothetical protein